MEFKVEPNVLTRVKTVVEPNVLTRVKTVVNTILDENNKLREKIADLESQLDYFRRLCCITLQSNCIEKTLMIHLVKLKTLENSYFVSNEKGEVLTISETGLDFLENRYLPNQKWRIITKNNKIFVKSLNRKKIFGGSNLYLIYNCDKLNVISYSDPENNKDNYWTLV
jgi:hypothetical protein